MSSLKVLLVDDEEDLVSALADRLAFRDIEAKCALNGAKAIEMVRKEAFDVVVLDLKLPGMSGDEVFDVIKRERPGLPVILITGHGAPPEELAGESRERADLLEKPVDLEVLLQKIKEAAKKG
ncbi:MAG: response regulator [Elusimicrobia bacterium]|nr:response regulator [Elusimicrobiota bacterium]